MLRRPLLRRLWPASLAGRTALVLLLGLILVQVAGLTIHALDRVDLQRFQQAREISARSFALWRAMLQTPPERRAALLADTDLPGGLRASLDTTRSRARPTPLPADAVPGCFRVDAMMSRPDSRSAAGRSSLGLQPPRPRCC
jgi:hypothetical protein